MEDELYPVASAGATESKVKLRFRGWLYVAMHGPEDDVTALTVCVDWPSACLALADAGDGDVLFVPPGDGTSFRRYLAGDDAPFPVPMARHPNNLVATVAAQADVSRPTARAAVHDFLRAASGTGGQLFREVEAIKASPLRQEVFSSSNASAPV